MVEDDFESFTGILDSVSGMISRGRYTPSADHAAVFFSALRQYSMADVSSAFAAHVSDPERGKFAPTPADILAQLEAARSDGRPGADEAWAMVPMDESTTVVWTNEMAEAFGIASPLLQSGDKSGARFAFREAYERIVAQAKRAGRRPVWSPSLGHDMAQRKQVLTAAVAKGLLTADAAHDACPALPLPASQRALLAGPATDKERFRATIRALAEAKRAESPDPLGWARRLEEREKRGETLHVSQREAWRRALWGSDIPEAVLFAGRTPIPTEVLPPAMRREAALVGDPSQWDEEPSYG
jgi:hypothetical protein